MKIDDIVAYDAQRNFKDKAFRSGCYAPFNSLFFDTHGNVLACCKSWQQPLGNLLKERLDDIWNGVRIKNMRRSLRDYEFMNGCEHCAWQIETGDYKGAFAHVFDNFAARSVQPEWPETIQFAGSNTCNLECIMCNADLSSKIRARDKKPPLPKAYNDQFFQDLEKYLPHLKKMEFFGGEPFYSKECFRIWDMLIGAGLKPQCHLSTNATHYNRKIEDVITRLPFSMVVSVDGATKETVESIRVGARFDVIMRNIKVFKEYTSSIGTDLWLSYCLMRQNWHEFVDFLVIAESLRCSVFVNTVLDPQECSLFSLPSTELEKIADDLEERAGSVRSSLTINKSVLDQQISVLRNNSKRTEDVTVPFST